MNEQDLEQKVDSPSGTMPVWSVCLFVGVVGTGLIGYLEWHVHLQKQREQEARYEARRNTELAQYEVANLEISREVDRLYSFEVNFMRARGIDIKGEPKGEPLFTLESDLDLTLRKESSEYIPRETYYSIEGREGNVFAFNFIGGTCFGLYDKNGDGINRFDERANGIISTPSWVNKTYLADLREAISILEQRYGDEFSFDTHTFPRSYEGYTE